MENNFLAECANVVGAAYVLNNANDVAPYLTDWRGRYTGRALAVVLPASTKEVAAIVKLCNQFNIAVVPQGGNTGLVLGSIPDQTGNSILLSLKRLNTIRSIDVVNNTITVDAGVILKNIQDAAIANNRLFPLSLASEGTCTIGGNLSSNAGGTAVLRYGNARELCLGLEVVTAQGDIWDGLKALRKNNTGYDLRDLFIGAEGTLGIITAASMRLYPLPCANVTALCAMNSIQNALRLLELTQSHCGAQLTSFELISAPCLALVTKYLPGIQQPFTSDFSYYVLLELSDHQSYEQANSLLAQIIEQALTHNIIVDAAIASSHTQSASLWQLRESIPAAQTHDGANIKHDISLPISAIDQFVQTTNQLLQYAVPGCRIINFGHLGDGNLHYNISAPHDMDTHNFMALQERINLIVYDNVHHFGGSISAEHGIGMLKNNLLLRYKSNTEIQMMRAIKHALDPLNLMNPGKIL